MTKLARWLAGTMFGLGVALAPLVFSAELATASASCSLRCTDCVCCTVREDGSLCDCMGRDKEGCPPAPYVPGGD